MTQDENLENCHASHLQPVTRSISDDGNFNNDQQLTHQLQQHQHQHQHQMHHQSNIDDDSIKSDTIINGEVNKNHNNTIISNNLSRGSSSNSICFSISRNHSQDDENNNKEIIIVNSEKISNPTTDTLISADMMIQVQQDTNTITSTLNEFNVDYLPKNTQFDTEQNLNFSIDLITSKDVDEQIDSLIENQTKSNLNEILNNQINVKNEENTLELKNPNAINDNNVENMTVTKIENSLEENQINIFENFEINTFQNIYSSSVDGDDDDNNDAVNVNCIDNLNNDVITVGGANEQQINDNQIIIENRLISDTINNSISAVSDENRLSLNNQGDETNLNVSNIISEDKIKEDPIVRLNKLRANISNALREVKGVLRKYSSTEQNNIDFEEDNKLNNSSQMAPVADDSTAVQFRFVRKIRRRSQLADDDDDGINQIQTINNNNNVENSVVDKKLDIITEIKLETIALTNDHNAAMPVIENIHVAVDEIKSSLIDQVDVNNEININSSAIVNKKKLKKTDSIENDCEVVSEEKPKKKIKKQLSADKDNKQVKKNEKNNDQIDDKSKKRIKENNLIDKDGVGVDVKSQEKIKKNKLEKQSSLTENDSIKKKNNNKLVKSENNSGTKLIKKVLKKQAHVENSEIISEPNMDLNKELPKNTEIKKLGDHAAHISKIPIKIEPKKVDVPLIATPPEIPKPKKNDEKNLLTTTELNTISPTKPEMKNTTETESSKPENIIESMLPETTQIPILVKPEGQTLPGTKNSETIKLPVDVLVTTQISPETIPNDSTKTTTISEQKTIESQLTQKPSESNDDVKEQKILPTIENCPNQTKSVILLEPTKVTNKSSILSEVEKILKTPLSKAAAIAEKKIVIAVKQNSLNTGAIPKKFAATSKIPNSPDTKQPVFRACKTADSLELNNDKNIQNDTTNEPVIEKDVEKGLLNDEVGNKDVEKDSTNKVHENQKNATKKELTIDITKTDLLTLTEAENEIEEDVPLTPHVPKDDLAKKRAAQKHDDHESQEQIDSYVTENEKPDEEQEDETDDTTGAAAVKDLKKRKAKKKVVIRRIKRKLSVVEGFPQAPGLAESAEICEKEIFKDDEENEETEDEAPKEKPKPKSCLKVRAYEPGDQVMYADRFKKTQVKWRLATVVERITSISYKLNIEGEEKTAHLSYIKKFTGKKLTFGGKEYLEIDYAQIEADEEEEKSYSIWNMV